MRRVGLGPALQRDVLVELVGIVVVRDVQVGTAVVVVVREDGAEAVADLRALEPAARETSRNVECPCQSLPSLR